MGDLQLKPFALTPETAYILQVSYSVTKCLWDFTAILKTLAEPKVLNGIANIVKKLEYTFI